MNTYSSPSRSNINLIYTYIKHTTKMASLTRSTLPRRTISTLHLLRPSINTIYQLSQPQPHHHQRLPLPTQGIRSYHSPLHARPPVHEYTNSQTAILTASLPHIPTHGFTKGALTLGARDAGFLDVSVQLLPRGEFDLILFWLASRRGLLRAGVEEGALLQRLAADAGQSVDGLGTLEKARLLVMERLRMNLHIKDQWVDVRFSFFLRGSGHGLAFSEDLWLTPNSYLIHR